MSKALQNHMESHSAEGTEGDGRDSTAKERRKKDDGKTSLPLFHYYHSIILPNEIVRWHGSKRGSELVYHYYLD